MFELFSALKKVVGVGALTFAAAPMRPKFQVKRSGR